jgi:hypothetical protein
MATPYNDQWVLQHSLQRDTIVRRRHFHRAVANTLEKRSHGVVRVPVGPIKQPGVSSIRALPQAGRRDF